MRFIVGRGLPRRNNLIIGSMPNYIRAKFEGGYYFFTVVTYRRKRIFGKDSSRQLFRQAINKTQSRHPFEIIAFCLLPDHLHCIWKLPENDADFSIRWSSVKGLFSHSFLQANRQLYKQSSRADTGEVCVWQKRFWEHYIRDERDLHRHINYIHYNPVKHGLVKSAEDWPWSTYNRFVKERYYGNVNGFREIASLSASNFGE